jgi:hypothetical protein
LESCLGSLLGYCGATRRFSVGELVGDELVGEEGCWTGLVLGVANKVTFLVFLRGVCSGLDTFFLCT